MPSDRKTEIAANEESSQRFFLFRLLVLPGALNAANSKSGWDVYAIKSKISRNSDSTGVSRAVHKPY